MIGMVILAILIIVYIMIGYGLFLNMLIEDCTYGNQLFVFYGLLHSGFPLVFISI